MIPVTSFAGKTVAVFGLGGSGLASCHALKAGGAEVIASDDGVDKLAEAAQAGFITADLRTVSWANFAALVLTPGAPLTHPAPHWSVLAARAAGVDVVGDIAVFCRAPPPHAAAGWSRNPADRIDRAGRRVVRVSVKNPLPDGIYVEREIVWRASGGARSEIARIGGIGSLRGLHNAQNAACAAGCALALGVSSETLQNGLRSVPGLEHRTGQVRPHR